MNDDYEAFCMADPLFYDRPGMRAEPDDFAPAARPAPAGWRRSTTDHWVMLVPEQHQLAPQGWKVHVSGRLDNAERIIDIVWAHCTATSIPFKFLGSRQVILARNAKYAGRGGSGKLVTAYPAARELEQFCSDLDRLLQGEPGPYILSDLRWGAGPVHVRYGGFIPRHCVDEHGETVLAIEDDTGALVPDRRGPTFALPPWVALPDALAPHLAARSAVTVANLPYTIDEALHFSNGGGVYAGTDRRTGDRVVLKEARPHAGLSANGHDAVVRLRHERDVLEHLDGIDAIPHLVDYFTLGEHEFLVMERITGEGLNEAMVPRHPLVASDADPEALADYTSWALAIHCHVSDAIEAVHRRGLAYGDLHLRNIIVRDDGGVSLIDFEEASWLSSERRQGLGAPGFTAPPDRTGADADRWALACLRVALFLPFAPLIGIDRAKVSELAAVAAATFPVPDGWFDEAVRVIAPAEGMRRRRAPLLAPDDGGAPGWPALRASIAGAIVASATPDRHDRLFPGDVAQFHTGGINIAHGAAGVLWALDATGAGRHPRLEAWLVERAREPGDDNRKLGFYDGLHGVAHVLAHLGHVDEALKLVDACLAERWEALGDDLYGGVAGIALNLAHIALLTGESALDDAALRATALVADRLGAVDDVATTSGGANPWAGLMRGGAGKALLFLHMYERHGEPALLDHAAIALRQDLRRCVRTQRGGHLHVDEGWRTMPYLASGSAGIGLVLDRYLARRSDERFAEAAAAIRTAMCSQVYVHAGLFNGRAGMVLALSDQRTPGSPACPEAIDQVRRLDWHALTYEGHLAFPGDQLLRLSMDLATGSAGVLLALGAALAEQPVHLPFLGAPLRPGPAMDHPTDETPGRR